VRSKAQEASGVAGALEGHLRVALHIRAVVVHHVILFHPAQLVLLGKRERLVLGLIPPLVGHGHGARRVRVAGHTRVQAVVLVRRDEGRVRPVDFDLASLGCPLVAVPDAGEDVHGLLVGKRHPHVFVVGEHPDGQLIHRESACAACTSEIRIVFMAVMSSSEEEEEREGENNFHVFLSWV